MPELTNQIIIDRIIGRKQLIDTVGKLYNIESWEGLRKFMKKNNLPLRRTPSGRPMFYTHELLEYDRKFQEIFSKLTIVDAS